LRGRAGTSGVPLRGGTPRARVLDQTVRYAHLTPRLWFRVRAPPVCSSKKKIRQSTPDFDPGVGYLQTEVSNTVQFVPSQPGSERGRQALGVRRRILLAQGMCEPISPYEERDCVKSLRSSYTGLCPHNTGKTRDDWSRLDLAQVMDLACEERTAKMILQTHQHTSSTHLTLIGSGCRTQDSDLVCRKRRACGDGPASK